MEEEIQTQPACKFSRVSSNGRSNTSKIGQKGGTFENQLLYPDEEEGDGELKRPNLGTIVVAPGGGGDSGGGGGTTNRLHGWHHSSRIIRVSRASGGKDRHSKVWTSKGPRDRRVRLSVATAIQFYDLQDRLGYDQPSKAVEWLIKAAADAINELPSLNGSNFPDTPKQLSDEKGFDSADVELEDPNFNQNQNQHCSLSKSACSSTSDTSKGSGLSLSRPDVRVNRVKARERARERTAKEKEKESHESSHIVHHQNVTQNSTFTELLTGGISSVSNNNNNNNNNAAGAATTSPGSEANLFHNHNKAASGRQWPNLTPMDYFSTGLLGPSLSRTSHHSSGFQLGNSIPQAMTMSIPPYSFSGENNHQEQLQHYPSLSDHLIPVATTTQQQQQQQGHGGDYNLNFTISSSGLAGFNRRTLQSNSSSSPLSFMPQHHLQRFSSSIDGGSSNLPFFIGATAAPQQPPMENHHHHHHHQFPPGLQLYGDGSRHSDHKGKGKN